MVAGRPPMSRLASKMLVEEEAVDHPISDVPVTIDQRACVPAAHRRDLLLGDAIHHGFVPKDRMLRCNQFNSSILTGGSPEKLL